MAIFFQRFYLDREKDIVVDLYMRETRLFYIIRTPNHHTGNLIRNMAKMFSLDTTEDENGFLTIQNEVPCYYDGNNRKIYIMRLGKTKVANIYPDGSVELKASIPAISKTLMSQTKDYRLSEEKTIVKTYIRSDCKFRTDLHTHMNGNLPPDILIALGITHQIRYPYYYIKKLGLLCTEEQLEKLEKERYRVSKELPDLNLTGRYRERRIDDYTYINFADLILGNPSGASVNIDRIRNSLTIPKDGQAVFANLEKVYLYRYIFTKGVVDRETLSGINVEAIPDREVRGYAKRMLDDRRQDCYRRNTLYQDLLLWVAREYQKHGIEYVEITDTALLNRNDFPSKLRQIHEIMPSITRETGVAIRFLAGIRRTPLTIVRDNKTQADYLSENLRCLRAVADDPYVAGSDIIGEEINDIMELRGMIRELVKIAGETPGFVIRIHAGENDSLPNNVANSILCVRNALQPDQMFPVLRIGHGLYTCDLHSTKGKRLLDDIRKYQVTLEFQLTSNVRLNNLSSLDRHPLKQYLDSGVSCVQGTDGGALYGTNSIDEELSLEKLLGLSHTDLLHMKESEERILKQSLKVFEEKKRTFQEKYPGGDLEQYFQRKLEKTDQNAGNLWRDSGKINTKDALSDRMKPLPDNRFPIIIAGGSFNNSQHRTTLREEDKIFMDQLIEKADPEKVVFIIGQSLKGQEGYVAKKAADSFPVYAIVPNRITRAEKARISDSHVRILLSIESSPMGLYKSFAYEIFKRMPSALIVFDGNSSALNLVQEGKNGREKCHIYINSRSRALTAKAKMLDGYVYPLTDADTVLSDLNIKK